jgi:nucleoside-diphosphate-sugar epimerase
MSERPDLVTGATGFVGSHLVRALRRHGRPVRALVRPGTRGDHLAAMGVEVVPGDVTDADGYLAAAHGAARVFHVAGFVSFLDEERKHLEAVNVGGVRNAIAAARSGGAEVLVVTSSVAAVGGGSSTAEVDETQPWHGDERLNYAATKHQGEAIALAAGRKGRLRVVCVNPSIVIGPDDPRPSSGGAYAILAAKGLLFAAGMVQGFVDARDCAEGHILAAEKGKSGERYILNGSSVPMRRFVAMCAAETGRGGFTIPLPRFLLPPIGMLMEWWADRRGVPPTLTLEQARMAQRHAAFSAMKAKVALGWKPRPLQDTVSDTVSWFEDHGML